MPEVEKNVMPGMRPEDFKQFAHEIINYIVDYNENIRSRQVLPNVTPGYLSKLLPSEAPEKPDHWTSILPDVEKCIMPGMSHWHSPSFNAYYTIGGSYPSILGELLAAGFGSVAFSWANGPAIIELEVIMMDWLAKMMGLPEFFLTSSHGPGGGIIQSSASEIILVSLLAAKYQAVKETKKENPSMDVGVLRAKLVAYSSDLSHSSLEKACNLGSVITRLIPSDSMGRIRSEDLQAAIEQDKAEGLIPFYVMASLGTTGVCSFDPLNEIGPVCQKYNLWFHVDASYAGAAFICPEYRHYLKGVEFADSFNTNPHKWLLINFDCSALWLKNSKILIEAFKVERDYLKDNQECDSKYAPTFRDWEIPLGRRFRALKMWFTFRLYGVEGLQNYIRKHCELARRFEDHVRGDDRFEVVFSAVMGLVCFRLKGKNELSKKMQQLLTRQKKVFMCGTSHRGRYFLRYVVSSRYSQESDIDQAWTVLKSNADHILSDPQDHFMTKISSADLPDGDKINLIRWR